MAQNRIIADFSNLNAVGKQMYLTEQGAVNPMELQNFDGQGYFEKTIQNNPNPSITPYGIVYRNKNEYEHIYDGKHFPQYNWEENMGIVTIVKGNEQEYLYLPFEVTELTKALKRLDADNIEECEIEIDSELLSDKILDTITEGKPINDKLICIAGFAKRIEQIGINEKPYLDTLIDCLNPQTEKDLNIIMDSMYEFEVFPNIHTAEEYGRYMICDSGHFECDENLEEYIDFDGYGSHRMKCENGAFTNVGYIVYHGYNMQLSDMLSEIGIEIKPQESQMLKLYMPLKATTYYDENDYGDLYQSDYEIEVYPEELSQYEDEILKAIEENSLPEEKKRGLMKYYGKADSVNAKVKRYNFSVETIRGELMGVATLELNAPLDDNEMAIIKEEISGQASDGFGETIEQKEIKCNGKEIYVSLWGAKDWSIKTAEEMGITEHCHEMQIGGM